MSAGPGVFRYALTSRVDDLVALMQALEVWASSRGVSSRTLRYVDLILDEITSNIMRHAYPGCDDGRIEICADFDGAEVCVTVRDYGPPFNPLDVPSPKTEATIDDRRLGGLGVHFVVKLSDRVRYRRDGDANEITFCRSDVRDGSA